MIEVGTLPEKDQPTQAYQNVHRLRTLMRQLYRAVGLDPNYATTSQGVHVAARKLTDDLILSITTTGVRNALKDAIANERIYAAQVGGTVPASLQAMVSEAYDLTQKIPSWDKLPDGKDANTLRAIEALLKTSKSSPDTVLKAVKLIIDPEVVIFKPKPPPKPKVHPKPVIKFDPPKPSYNMTPVNKEGPVGSTWGYQVPYYMIKNGQPMTWAACLQWVVKIQGEPKPGKHGDKFYVHPSTVTNAQLKHHNALQVIAEKMTPGETETVTAIPAAAVFTALNADPPEYVEVVPYEADHDDEGSF